MSSQPLKSILPVILERHQFTARDLVGGDPAIDFINTVTGRDQKPRDWLDSYDRLIEWAALVQLLPEQALKEISKAARHSSAAVAGALARAKALREALFRLISAIGRGSRPAQSDLALLRKYWIAGTNAHDLRFEQGQIVAALSESARSLDLIGCMIAYGIVHRILLLPADRLRMCEGGNCSWLFIDRSKAGRRRWCDMAVCGNAAKSRRFHERSREHG